MMKIIFATISLWCFGQVYTQLILTPLLDAGEYMEAQEQSKVDFSTFDGDSYAAYFQVVPETNSNIFFWFFPSRNNIATDPVLLCLQGGPGLSSLFTLFFESGPYVISEQGDVTDRINAWTSFSSVLYIDSPFGTGFSFTDAGSEATDLRMITYYLLMAVKQFFQLFPNLRSNDFFILGESYGGKYVPALGFAIDQFDDDINFKGVCIGNGLTDPRHQIGYGEYLNQLGLIDEHAKASIEGFEAIMVGQFAQEDYAAAYATFAEILTVFFDNTGYDDIYNHLSTTNLVSGQETALNVYLNLPEVKEALHVGNVTFLTYNPTIPGFLTDFFKPVPQLVSYLLNNDYKVLIYTGQLDMLIPYVGVVNYLRELEFSGSDEYRNAPRHIWRVNNDVGGYVKKGGNLYEVLVRNAGHNAPRDQPEFVSDMLQRFMFNRDMWD